MHVMAVVARPEDPPTTTTCLSTNLSREAAMIVQKVWFGPRLADSRSAYGFVYMHLPRALMATSAPMEITTSEIRADRRHFQGYTIVAIAIHGQCC
jgi:hypothetical protein